MNARESYKTFFQKATGHVPYDYQIRLAMEQCVRQLVEIATGLGKTAAVVLAWLWQRRFAEPHVREATPRRLVYCLPMRVLVEQTESWIRTWLGNLGLSDEVRVHVLMGGEEATGWDLYPEKDAVLIGTQDMLLSRALNRGYAMSRYRWPMHFGLLNNDCLWVLDEVQVMGSGLATTAQLDAFRKQLWNPVRTCRSLWMSATLGTHLLRTRDRDDWAITTQEPFTLLPQEREQAGVRGRLFAAKSVELVPAQPRAKAILDKHVAERISLVVVNTVPAAHTVFADLRSERAKRTGKKGSRPQPEMELLHSRFRPVDRRRTMDRLLTFIGSQCKEVGAVPDHPGLILVATQVVEAGFDISAARLWSEISPWPSVVQRLGRLNREGKQPDATAVFWMPRAERKGENDKSSPNAKRVGPYENDDLNRARALIAEMIRSLERKIKQGKQDAAYREALEEAMSSEGGQAALRIEPQAVIRPDDLFGLFSTEPDLAGGFTNVSQFVRDQDRNADAHVFWREFDAKRAPANDELGPERDELCPVPFYALGRFLGDKGHAWEWNFEWARWERRRARDLCPGMTLLLARAQGGYSDELGWTGNVEDKPTLHPGPAEIVRAAPPEHGPDALHLEPTSESDRWVPLDQHLADVERRTREILSELRLNEKKQGQALLAAARWHDWGKSLERWQKAVQDYAARVVRNCEAILANGELKAFHEIAASLHERLTPPAMTGSLWAKWPDMRRVWSDERLSQDQRKQLRKLLYTPFNAHLRHEAGSALAAWHAWRQGQAPLTALAVYLIASHHGKVRTNLRSTNRHDEVFGLREDDRLQPVPGYFTEPAPFDFQPKMVAAAGEWDERQESFTVVDFSWTAMIAELLGPSAVTLPQPTEVVPEGEPRAVGPFVLAYLEALFRAADARASSEIVGGGDTQ